VFVLQGVPVPHRKGPLSQRSALTLTLNLTLTLTLSLTLILTRYPNPNPNLGLADLCDGGPLQWRAAPLQGGGFRSTDMAPKLHGVLVSQIYISNGLLYDRARSEISIRTIRSQVTYLTLSLPLSLSLLSLSLYSSPSLPSPLSSRGPQPVNATRRSGERCISYLNWGSRNTVACTRLRRIFK